jgi:hypothetical protein
MTNRFSIAFLLLLIAPAAVADQNVCPCIPLSQSWVVAACETWNCAQAAMILANGDSHVIAVPSSSDQYKWIVLRRVVAGSGIEVPDSPFVVDSFPSVEGASALFSSLDRATQPMLLTTVDGDMLVVRLRTPEKKRAVSH